MLRKFLLALTLTAGLAGNAGAIDLGVGNLTGTSFAQAYTYRPDAVIHDLSSPSSFRAVAGQVALRNFFDISNFSLALSRPNGPTPSFAADSRLMNEDNSWSLRVVAGAWNSAANPPTVNAVSAGNITIGGNKRLRTGNGSIDVDARGNLNLARAGSVMLTGIRLLPLDSDFGLTETGSVHGSLGGGYCVLMPTAGYTAAAAVPEPAEWLLMLAGLVMIIAIASGHRGAAGFSRRGCATRA